MSVNKVILLGRLGKDPEVNYMPNGDAVANFSIATSEKWKDKSGESHESTEWHNIVAFRRIAEVIGEYVKKGDMIYIEGKLKTDKYEKDGVTRYSTKIIMERLEMLGGKRSEEGDTDDAPQRQEPARQTTRPAPQAKPQGFDNFDDDIPF